MAAALGTISAFIAAHSGGPRPLPDRIWVMSHEEDSMMPAGPCYEDANCDREILGYEFESTWHWLTMRWIGGSAATTSAARDIDNRLRDAGTRYVLSQLAADPHGNRVLVYDRDVARSEK